MNFEFKNGELKFCFRNPKWEESCNNLVMEYKVEGVKENKKGNDGYYWNSTFEPKKGAMAFNLRVNGREYSGVKLPEDILLKVTEAYEELKEKDCQRRLNSDISYTLHDMESYGIYNGISQFDIAEIVSKLKQELECDAFIFEDEIAKILTTYDEVKKIAEETYVPFPEHKDWSEEYKECHREAVKEGIAPGHGTIPNKIAKEKIKGILLAAMEKEREEKRRKQEELEAFFKLAESTGKKQCIRSWHVPCCDPKEECSLDICYEFAMPDGTTKVEKNHTW